MFHRFDRTWALWDEPSRKHQEKLTGYIVNELLEMDVSYSQKTKFAGISALPIHYLYLSGSADGMCYARVTTASLTA